MRHSISKNGKKRKIRNSFDDYRYSLAKRQNNDSSDEYEEDCSSDHSRSNVYSVNNDVYFYSDVTNSSCFELNREIRKVTKQMLNLATRYSIDPPPVKLHIKSYGGSVFAAISTIDTILNNEIEVHSIIEGCAASAGTLISIVCHKRFIMEHAYMLIHELRSGCWGKMSEIKDDFTNNNELMNLIKTLYSKHTKVPKRKIDEILEHDLWWNAKKCLELNLVDEIM